jgi:hypothetical protein
MMKITMLNVYLMVVIVAFKGKMEVPTGDFIAQNVSVSMNVMYPVGSTTNTVMMTTMMHCAYGMEVTAVIIATTIGTIIVPTATV